MAFREFDSPQISRRSLLRGGGYLAAGGALTTLPLSGSILRAHDVGAMWPNVAAMTKSYLSSNKVPNLLVAFGRGQDDIAHTVGGGTLSFRSSQQVDLDSLYRIYSMSKPVTGMATMMLVDEGKIGLDQPVAEILPEFSNMQVMVDPEGSLDNTVPAERPITIRQLLTHTAGLGYIIGVKGPLLAAYAQNGLVAGRVSRMPIPGLPEVTPAPDLETWSERLASLPLVAQPGKKWIYSASIDLLGRVIEVASGQDFESFLQQRIFEPCGMGSTYFTVPQSEVGRLTTNYGVNEMLPVPLPIDPGATSIYLDKPSVPSGGGGLVSSARDYDRFLRMLLGYGKIDGRRVMGELAVRVGTSNLLPKSVDTAGSWIEGEGHGAGGRSTGTSFGWGGAAGTLASVDFGLDMRVGLFTQYMPAEAYSIRADFLSAIEQDLTVMRGAA